MDQWVPLTTMVAAQGAVLLVPWLACWGVFYGEEITPYASPPQAELARRVRLAVGLPLAVALTVVTWVWLSGPGALVLAVFVPVAWRLVGRPAYGVARTLPALTRAYPVVVAPLAVGAAALTLAETLGRDAPPWWQQVGVAALVALLLPLLVVAVGHVVGRALVAVGLRVLRRRFPASLVRSDGAWTVCRLGLVDGEAVLLFNDASPLDPFRGGLPARFRVTLSADDAWSPDPELLARDRLAEQAGGGPVRAAVLGPVAPGLRGAEARLDDRTVMLVEERRPGGDDLFAFVASLHPA